MHLLICIKVFTLPKAYGVFSKNQGGKCMMLRILMISAIFLVPCQSWAFECKVCHSKNPAMVRMHKALQGRGCFDCHKPGEKLMGKAQPKDRESLLKRRASDQLCMECHKPGV